MALIKNAKKGLAKGRLVARVAALEAEVQECRQTNLRLAELTDVVIELLVPLADRDEARVAEVLQRYQSSVGFGKQ